MEEKYKKCRKETTQVHSYLRRQVSIYLTIISIKLGLRPEPVLIFWGLLSVSNGYFIYKAINGNYYLTFVVFLVYVVADILDVVDGEIARYRNLSNPISGKVLDGMCHRLTEYSILVSFTLAVYNVTQMLSVFVLGLLLLLGEAMYTYCNERKLLVIRLYAKKSAHIAMTEKRISTTDSRWMKFTIKEKIESLKGFLSYKSIYLMILLSYISTNALLGGFIFLTAYKHFAWIKMVANLYFHPPEMKGDT